MELTSIKNYFYIRDTLFKFSTKGYGELSAVRINILFYIHYMNDNGLLCTKKLMYEFMSINYPFDLVLQYDHHNSQV